MEGEIVGFDILSTPSPGVGEGVLVGVTPSVQKLGVGWSFVQPALTWLQSNGVTVLFGATQATNITSQKGMIELKYQPSTSIYTFHKWFDE